MYKFIALFLMVATVATTFTGCVKSATVPAEPQAQTPVPVQFAYPFATIAFDDGTQKRVTAETLHTMQPEDRPFVQGLLDEAEQAIRKKGWEVVSKTEYDRRIALPDYKPVGSFHLEHYRPKEL